MKSQKRKRKKVKKVRRAKRVPTKAIQVMKSHLC